MQVYSQGPPSPAPMWLAGEIRFLFSYVFPPSLLICIPLAEIHSLLSAMNRLSLFKAAHQLIILIAALLLSDFVDTFRSFAAVAEDTTINSPRGSEGVGLAGSRLNHFLLMILLLIELCVCLP